MFKLIIVALAAVLGLVAAKPGFAGVGYGYTAPVAYSGYTPYAYHTAPVAYSAPYAYSGYAAPYSYPGFSTYASPYAYSGYGYGGYPYLWKKR